MVRLDDLFDELACEAVGSRRGSGARGREGLEVLSWRDVQDRRSTCRYRSLTRRPYAGEASRCERRWGGGSHARPTIHSSCAGTTGLRVTKLARDLSDGGLAAARAGRPSNAAEETASLELLDGADALGLPEREVIVRAAARARSQAVASSQRRRAPAALDHPRGSRIRLYDVARAGALRMDERGRSACRWTAPRSERRRTAPTCPPTLDADATSGESSASTWQRVTARVDGDAMPPCMVVPSHRRSRISSTRLPVLGNGSASRRRFDEATTTTSVSCRLASWPRSGSTSWARPELLRRTASPTSPGPARGAQARSAGGALAG